MSEKKVRTRFAPSPTGYMHVGGVRTALFAWLVAKQASGRFLLRIEDTDRVRHVAGSEQHIIDSLQWLGIESDEKPMHQSDRLDLYKEWAQKLIDNGRAYADPYSKEELESFRDQAAKTKRPFLFRDHRPDNPPKWDGSLPLRFKSEPKDYKWHDEVMGDLSIGPEAIDDFIIMKSDGYPTYNFAHIVDDHDMNISHVIRTQEFLPSVPKFLNLYEALEIERPKLATLPYVMGPDGKKKLSKRDGAKDILDYKREGYLPEALINFLATLGWNDGTEQEIFSVDELIKKFDLSRVQRSGAHFDEQRLVWMNGHYIRELSLDELYGRAESFWPEEAKEAGEDYKKAALGVVKDRLKKLSELPALTGFFFKEPELNRGPHLASLGLVMKPTPEKREKEKKLVSGIINATKDSDFSEKDLVNRLNESLEKLETQPAELFKYISSALTGELTYPPLHEIMSVLGKDETLKRLNNALSKLEK